MERGLFFEPKDPKTNREGCPFKNPIVSNIPDSHAAINKISMKSCIYKCTLTSVILLWISSALSHTPMLYSLYSNRQLQMDIWRRGAQWFPHFLGNIAHNCCHLLVYENSFCWAYFLCWTGPLEGAKQRILALVCTLISRSTHIS